MYMYVPLQTLQQLPGFLTCSLHLRGGQVNASHTGFNLHPLYKNMNNTIKLQPNTQSKGRHKFISVSILKLLYNEKRMQSKHFAVQNYSRDKIPCLSQRFVITVRFSSPVSSKRRRNR